VSDFWERHRGRLFANFFFCSLGCAGCFFLQRSFGVPGVVASLAVGFTGSFLPPLKGYDQKQAVAGLYSGSFAGMCSLSLLASSADVVALSFLVSLYFFCVSPFFRGLGGKLGSIAFLASVTLGLLKGLL